MLSLHALAVVVALATGDEKITLKSRPEVGDRIVKTMTSTSDLDLDVNGMAIKSTVTTSRRTTEDVLAVQNGEKTKVRRHYEESVRSQTMPGSDALRRTEDPVHGRTITLTLKDGKTSLEGADGLDDATLATLRLGVGYEKLLPSNPVAPGDRWQHKGDDFFESGRAGGMDGTADLTLKSVEPVGGERCAKIAAKIHLTGTNEKGLTVTIDLDADLVVTVERGYAVSFAGSGKMHVEGDASGASVRGDGPVKFDGTAKVERTPESAPAKRS